MAHVQSCPIFLKEGDGFRVLARVQPTGHGVITILVGYLDVTFYLPEGADLDEYMAQLHAATAPQPEEVAA